MLGNVQHYEGQDQATSSISCLKSVIVSKFPTFKGILKLRKDQKEVVPILSLS